MELNGSWEAWLWTFALLAGTSLALGLLLMGIALWQVRRLRLPPNTGFVEAMQMTPLIVVLVLDLLDFSLDFLSAPIAWVFLTKMGLQPLRGATFVEALFPGTQFIPTMTVAWVGVRLLGPSRVKSLLRE
jgi:hypothetical protein